MVNRSVNPLKTHITKAARVLDAQGIFDTGVNIALIQRDYPTIIKSEFEDLNQRLKGEFRGTLSRAQTMGPLAAFILEFCRSRTTARIILNELTTTVHDFMELTGSLSLTAIFGQITSDHCRLFHDDKNQLRLVVTYTGKGTEWLKNEDVHRSGLGTGTNAGYIDGRPIQRLRPYDIAIMKGGMYRGNEGNGVVHRSPPFLKEDTPRIFLALDAEPVYRHDLHWRKLNFPAKKTGIGKWRVSSSEESLFCREVRARFERSMRDKR